MTYSEQEFTGRYEILGSWAEAACEDWLNKRRVRYVRRGWDKPPFDHFYNVNPVDRATPDYVIESGEKHFYIEVKGTKDHYVKIKEESIEALAWWRQFHPVWFFIWNSHIHRHFLISYDDVVALIPTLEKQTFENDGKTYWNVPCVF